MNVALVRVHEPDAVREIIDAAYGLAHEMTSDPAQWSHVFDKAVDLLAARIPLMPHSSAPVLDLSTLNRKVAG